MTDKQRWLFGLLVCWVATLIGSPEARSAEAVPNASVEVAQTPQTAEASPELVEKRRRAYAGLLALAGIALLGVMLAVLTIVWARRLRRLNRQPPPNARLQDEFWFLRKPKPPVSEQGLSHPNRVSNREDTGPPGDRASDGDV